MNGHFMPGANCKKLKFFYLMGLTGLTLVVPLATRKFLRADCFSGENAIIDGERCDDGDEKLAFFAGLKNWALSFFRGLPDSFVFS